ncbi:MAG: DUF5752 family protein [Pseudomonadota bacterium]
MEKVNQSFEFKLCASLLRFTGKKAKNLRELREGIAGVSQDSIFHHTCQYFLKGPVHEYTNDFAHWAGESLEERALSEHLSNIDPYFFLQIQDLRWELLRVIDEYLSAFPEPREVFPGDEFYFNETITIVAPLGIRVRNLAEFLMAIKYVDPGSLYYHFYEAKIRLGGGINDFSAWMATSLDKKELAEKIKRVDPFMHNLEEIRDHLIELVEKEARLDMEVF